MSAAHTPILVVDDNEVMRSMLGEVLATLGYQVLHAGNADEAEAVARTHSEVALMLSDVMLPGTDGASLVRRLRQWLPQLTTVFISGYPRANLDRLGIVLGNAPLLGKPFSAADLQDALAEAHRHAGLPSPEAAC